MKRDFTPDLALSVGLAPNRFPETREELEKAENALQQELEKLSLDEYERILFDIHGLPGHTPEEPEDTSTVLAALENELESIKLPERCAFDSARALNPEYVDGSRFRLMFLRAENFDAKAAAETIVTHFEVKKKIWGEGEILGREVFLDDFDRWSAAMLELGFYQVLPTCDAAGRAVVAMSPEFHKFVSKELAMVPISRVVWYINMVLARDEHIQKHGVVNLMYNFNHYVEEVNLENTIHRMRSAMPLRLDAVHLCFKDPKMMDCATGVKLFIDQESRYRIRTHCGSQSEIDFELSTFGIPTHDSPMGGNGTWSTVFHHEWIAVQATREKGLCEHAKPNQQEEEYFGEDDNDRADVILDRENQVISLPRRFDVLFGKTKRARCATGTVRANHICEMHREKYEAANKFQKTAIAERIVGLVHESGGRFLIQQKTGGWVEVSHKQARDKIAHFFRHGRAKSKRNQESIDANNSRSTGTGVQRQGIKRVSPSTSPEPSTTHLPTSCDAEESSCSSQRSSVNE